MIRLVWIRVRLSNSLVERAEAAGHDHEGAGIADEHQLAGEEVVEVEAAVDVGVGLLLVRQLDVEPDRESAGFVGAAVGCLHQARPAAGDHGEAVFGKAGRCLAAELVPAVALGDPGRAENRDAVVDVAQRVEAALDLVVDPAEPQVVLLLDVAGGAQQQLVVLPPGLPCGLAKVPPTGFEPAPRGLKGRRSNQLSYRGKALNGNRAPWTRGCGQESSGKPCSGVEASAWVRRGMRPAPAAAWPASTPRRRAVAIATGSSAPKIELAAITASQPSSIARAASEAVPMPASRIDRDRGALGDDRDVVRVADAGAGADRRAERHHRGAAGLLEAAGEDRVVVGVGEDGEALADQGLGGVEQLDRVGEEGAVVADHLELDPVGLEGLAGELGGADRVAGGVATGRVGQGEEAELVEHVEDRALRRRGRCGAGRR